MSFLELTTFTHSLCALVIYMTWWDKPYDVTIPIVLKGELATSISAFNLLHQWLVMEEDETSNEGIHMVSGTKSSKRYVSEHYYVLSQPFPEELLQRDQEGYWFYKDVKLGTGAITVEDVLSRVSRSQTRDSPPENLPLPPSFAAWVGDETRYERWKLLWSLLQQFPSYKVYQFQDVAAGGVSMKRFAIPTDSYVVGLLGLTLPGLIYGGLHALAWNAALPTGAELLLWRVSVVVIATGGFAFAMSASLIDEIDKLGARKTIQTALETINILCLVLLVLIYFSARAYLIVESFRALPYSPSGVYELPQWSAYFPHIG